MCDMRAALFPSQHVEAVQRLEDRINLAREECHQKERLVAELHISHQVRQG